MLGGGTVGVADAYTIYCVGEAEHLHSFNEIRIKAAAP